MATKSAALRLKHLRHHHFNEVFAWAERHRKLLDFTLAGVLIFALLSVVVQLLYPANKTLPFMRIGGLDVSAKEQSAVLAQLDEYAQNGEVVVKTPSREWRAKWHELGLSIDREASADAVVEYPVWERVIPFSSIFHVLQLRESSLIALVDEERLSIFAEKLVAEDRLAARDATISIKDGQVQLDEAKNGYRYAVAEVKRQIQGVPMTTNSSLELIPEPVPFVRSKAELQTVATEAERLLARELKLTVADKTYKPDRQQVGQWLVFSEDNASKKLLVTFNKEAIKAYLEQIDRDIRVEAGTTTITLLDGQEIARTPAASGRTVAVDSAIAAIEERLRATTPPADLPLQLVAVPPKTQHVRTYSQANSGLQALIHDWEAANYGDYGIIVRELGGQNRYADWQPDKDFVTASTYKMFLAYTVFIKMERGEIKSDQRTDMGWTVDECIREMIVNSTNPCAISLQNLVGWQVVDDMLREAGFSATTLNNRSGGDKHSTVRDETNFLLRLHSGTLMSKEHSDYLLSLLKRQVWRAGIPSGVPRGTVVADKVGLYGSWVHDVAIVYGPKSTYILGIMSRGGSDPKFADLSRRVYNFFNQ